MLKIKEITSYLDGFAPLTLQESYDNAGLLVGDPNQTISSVLVTLDITEDVLEEAINKGAGLVIAHHPIILSGLKKINGNNYTERCIIKAIKNNIAVYASHTNLDSVTGGVNSKICKKLGLEDCKVLQASGGLLKKLVTFVPVQNISSVQEALFAVGVGHIGNYDSCSFQIQGKGSFRGNAETNPFVGNKEELHYEEEVRFESIFPSFLQGKVIQTLLKAHPYEEVAYDIYPLDNKADNIGMGMVGNLPEALPEKEFLSRLKEIFNTGIIKHTALMDKMVRRVALCGGSGSFLLKQAIAAGADVFVSGDFKYHQFFDADNKIIIADIGHFESEQFTKELFYELLTKKFPKFAVHLSEVNTNPVFYF